MKKCPKCNKELPDDHQFCPRCGYKFGTTIDFNRMGRMFFISFFAIPVFYLLVFAGLDFADSNLLSSQKVVLKDVQDKTATTIVFKYESLEEFEENVEDVESYTKDIRDFEKNLIDDDVKKDYAIYILDNYDISFTLSYLFENENNLKVDVFKQYTRSGIVDNLEYSFTQEGIQSLEDISIDYDYLKQYVSDVEGIEKIYNQLMLRSEEFINKKDNIGHFGFGEYLDDMSLVVYPHKDSFKVTLKCK